MIMGGYVNEITAKHVFYAYANQSIGGVIALVVYFVVIPIIYAINVITSIVVIINETNTSIVWLHYLNVMTFGTFIIFILCWFFITLISYGK